MASEGIFNGADKNRLVSRLGLSAVLISISEEIFIYISYSFTQVLMERNKTWKSKQRRRRRQSTLPPLRKGSVTLLPRCRPLRNLLSSNKQAAAIDLNFISPASSSNLHHLNIYQDPLIHETLQINESCSADLSPLICESLDADICSDDDGSVFVLSESGSGSSSSDDDSVSSSEIEEEVMIPVYKAALRSIPSYMAHLSSKLANRSIKGGIAVLMRTATFLSWYSNNLNEKLLVDGDVKRFWPVFELLYRFIKREYSLLIGFFDFLVQHRGLRGSSIVNYNNDIVISVQWFVWFRGVESDEFTVSPIDLTPLNIVFEKMRAAYSKQRRIEESVGFEDIDDLISNGKWPVNGFSDLNRAVIEEAQYFIKLIRNDDFVLTKKIYSDFMRLLCGSFYGTSIQGRINGIRNLTLKQVKLLLKDDFALSKDFKTVKTFGFQPISSSPVCKVLLKYLLLYLRPAHFDKSDHAYLFVSWHGNRIDVGKFVSKFFRVKLGIRINTTRIRAIVETSAEDLHLNGTISSADRASVLAVNGHSEKIMKRHYLKRSRIQDAMNVKSVLCKLTPNVRNAVSVGEQVKDDDNIALVINDDVWGAEAEDADDGVVSDDDVADDGIVGSIVDDEGNLLEFSRPKMRKVDMSIGALHPDIDKTSQRIPWSPVEKKYVG